MGLAMKSDVVGVTSYQGRPPLAPTAAWLPPRPLLLSGFTSSYHPQHINLDDFVHNEHR